MLLLSTLTHFAKMPETTGTYPRGTQGFEDVSIDDRHGRKTEYASVRGPGWDAGEG
jgi:hypothetical protein